MQDELRKALAAARICRELNTAGLGEWWDASGKKYDSEAIEVMQGDMANGFLAEHPAGDEIAVDEAWLRSVGAVQDSRFSGRWILPVSAWVVTVHGECLWLNGAIVVGHPTRGAVRRLCAALGISLKEPA